MKIACGNWELEVDADHGGMVRALTRRGIDILRPSPAGNYAPFESASFAMAPYVNRIAEGRFDWNGQTYCIPANHFAQRHPLHGTACLGKWEVEQTSTHALVLTFEHEADEHWPWPFRLRQSFEVTQVGLSLRLEIENTANEPVPVSLGFHPWFARDGVSAIAFDANSVWLTDAEMLPTQPAPAEALGDWSTPCPLHRDDLIDNCYAGWDGTLRILREDGDLILKGEGTNWLHLFIPPGKDFFCAEPQDAMPDAVNRKPPAPLMPGEKRAIAMHIRNA